VDKTGTGDTGDTVDTVDTIDTVDTVDTMDTTPAPEEAILGSWVSAGADVAPLLTLFGVVQVDATFNADGTYSVTSLDGAGTPTNFSGTYTVAVDTTPHTIVTEQTVPSVLTAEGIWQVDAMDVMSYEVVQTTPDLGFAAPTPAGGFGSTSGPGLNPGDNVQVFRRP
jgi:hypothetical protein